MKDSDIWNIEWYSVIGVARERIEDKYGAQALEEQEVIRLKDQIDLTGQGLTWNVLDMLVEKINR